MSAVGGEKRKTLVKRAFRGVCPSSFHLILVQYRGPKMANCELVGERKL